MISQVLGLADDKNVNEVILGFLLSIGSTNHESNSIHCFSLDEFLAEVIHTQLVEFPKVRFFRYQSYLLNMLLCSNVSELQFLCTMFSLDLPKQINMFEFVNTIIVTERNSYGLGYHNRQLDSRNQSFPICKRNKISNTKGSDLVPYFGQLK